MRHFCTLLFVLSLLGSLPYSIGLLYSYVTCGSAIKLVHANYKARLHSHEVQYGSGSGQQSVTGNTEMDDVNSHWLVKGPVNKSCQRGVAVQCGDTVRLEHLTTKKNLHSHLFPAPLSHGQEVSAFGTNGEGDTGDNWTIMCNGNNWERDDNVMLKHSDTSMYLAISGQTFGQPIPGQLEVVAINAPDSQTYWNVGEGVFIKPSDLPQKVHEHTEL